MIDKQTEFFKQEDNFAKTAHISSVSIKKAMMPSPVKITIAIPTYKRANLLKEALDSAINQHYEDNYEIMVVDNSSQRGDETELLMETYGNIPNLSYYKNEENLGMVGNWNRLYKLAQGEWVVMLHDDDLLQPNYLEKMIPLLKDRIGLVACRYRKLRDGKLPEASKGVSIYPINFIDFAWGNCIGAPVGVLMNKKKVCQLGGFNADFYPASDYVFFALMTKEYTSLIVKEQLSVYRLECNASLKTEVLDGFMMANYYLSNVIWEMCEVPSFLRKSIQICRIKKQIKSLRRNWNRTYKCASISTTNNILLYWYSYFMYKMVYLNYIRVRKRMKHKYYAQLISKIKYD